MPGHRNPLGISGLADQIHDAMSKAKSNMHDLSDVTKTLAKDKNFNIPYVDLHIQVSNRDGLQRVPCLDDICSSSEPEAYPKWTS
jgi:hypothetical protein